MLVVASWRVDVLVALMLELESSVDLETAMKTLKKTFQGLWELDKVSFSILPKASAARWKLIFFIDFRLRIWIKRTRESEET